MLEDELRQRTRGEVRFSAGDRAIYAADASNYRHIPRGVFIPRSIEEIAVAIDICADHNVAVVHRGGGTALAGQTIGPEALVIDSSKYCNRIASIDVEQQTATVEPGVVLDDLRDAAKLHGLTFGPDPSTHNHCTMGGMIGNNSCGVHSVMSGRTLDNVHALEILTHDGVRMKVGATTPEQLEVLCRRPGREGNIYNALRRLQHDYADEIRAYTPKIPRLVSGYRLDQLLPENGFHVARALVGSEGTCVSVLEATLRLVPDPVKKLVIASFGSLAQAADAVPAVLAMGPVACEAMDETLTGFMFRKNMLTGSLEFLPKGKAWLLIEAPGESEEAAAQNAQRFMHRMRECADLQACKIVDDEKEVAALWEVRKSSLGATSWVPGIERASWDGWEDSAVHPDQLGTYVRKLGKLLHDFGYQGAMYGHFGDGLIHVRIDFGLETQPQVDTFRRFLDQAADLVVSLGGTLSGEHGDGQARSELLPKMYSEKMLQAFREFKQIWDPNNGMNPGNIVAPRKITDDLRFGPRFKPERIETVFQYPESDGDFRRAAIRCVGVGECRREKGGTMCPSYRATRDEKHCTRGRARLFQEMLQGDPVRDGWRSTEVREALHLCLACKACKSECPVNVDMATYKAEFYYHHYKNRLRPPIHLGIGNIPTLSRVASAAPTLANFVTRQNWVKRIMGIHVDRQLPRFAQSTFRSRWRGARGTGNTRAILWVDTFNNHFSPQVLHAAAQVLEHAGCSVQIPQKNLCCGRPYYDFGLLDQAKKSLGTLMEQLTPLLDDNSWIVGTEPSCIAVFKDELINIFPDDPRARRISERTLMLADFLMRHTDYKPPDVARKLVVHGHCHHKSILGMEADERLLRDANTHAEMLDSGCCGMGGSFGYEKDKYEHSLAIANQVLMPAIRSMDANDLLVSDGFSCRTQIAHLAQQRAWTLPEILVGAYK